jgi:dihydrofolate reductase
MAPSRSIVIFEWLTTDGYFAGPDGNLNWVVPDDEQAKDAAAGMLGADIVLFGRRTYELFEGFWRKALQDSSTAPDPHRPGQRSKEHRAIAVWMNDATKLVFSRTLKEVTWNNARLVRELDVEEIAALKQQPGKTMMIFGSGSIVAQLTQNSLIDEYQFVVCPVFLGAGRRLLEGVSKSVKLELLESRKYPSGDVSLRYAPRTESAQFPLSHA